MPNYANFQIPFLGGGPSISEQIMQGLHEGFAEKQAQQQLALEQQRVQNESTRNSVLNQLTQAQIQHESNVSAFEKETNPIKKAQLLNDLQDSAIKLGIAKHQAKYFGIDADALTNAVSPEGVSPTPTTTGTSTSTAAQAGPTPFEQEMDRTAKLLGPMTPEEQSIWENAKTVAARSLNPAPITAAIGKISENRQAIHKAELETTPFKTWQSDFIKEHGRPPNSQEVENFNTAGQRIRIEGLQNLRNETFVDTSQNPPQVTQMSVGEFNDANKKEPGRFVQYSSTVQNTLKARSLISDIKDGMTQMKTAVDALPSDGLSSGARGLLQLAAKSPDTAVQTVMAGLASKKLSEPEQDFLIAHATLLERAMSMRGLQGQGAGSDQQRSAIASMLPGFASADQKMMHKQLNTLKNNVDNLDKTIPNIGKMSRSSAGEASAPAKAEAAPVATHRYNPETGQIEEIKQ